MGDLMKKMEQYAGDMQETCDRFLGDEELYRFCLKEFMQEQGFLDLEEAVKTKDYKKAFEAAHSLKGVSGNLGLKPLYESICILVELLRAEDYGQVEQTYQEVIKERENLNHFLESVL